MSILPRGMTLGSTRQVPADDRHLATRSELGARLRVLMGGYAAEQVVLGEPSSGAENDLRRATEIAYDMVAHYGMSDAVGPVFHEHRAEHPFLGLRLAEGSQLGPAAEGQVDAEVQRTLTAAAADARALVEQHRRILDRLVGELLARETVEQDDLPRAARGDSRGRRVMRPLVTAITTVCAWEDAWFATSRNRCTRRVATSPSWPWSEPCYSSATMKVRQEAIPGSGLPIAALLGLLGASIGLFMVWNGLLWRAPREASHVSRFVVSYLAVVPLGAAMLLALRRWSWTHLITTTFVVWSIKLVVTAALYQAFARGTATQLVAVAPPAVTSSAPGRNDYRAAVSFASGTVAGHVRLHGAALAGAVVLLDAPLPGRAVPAAQKMDLVVSGSRYAEPLYLAHVDDAIDLVNRDGVLHTAHLTGAGTMPQNRPMPPSADPQRLSLTEPGLYHLRCDNHPGEATWIVVVDHPYATRTGADGAFRLDGVAAGDARLVVLAPDGAAVRRAEQHASVQAGETVEPVIDLDRAPEISP